MQVYKHGISKLSRICPAPIRGPDFAGLTPFGRLSDVIRTGLSHRFHVAPVSKAHAGLSRDRRSSHSRRNVCNRSLGAATLAGLNITYRPCLTNRAPIFARFSRRGVGDQGSTCIGSAGASMNLARSWAGTCSQSRTALSWTLRHESRVRLIAFSPSRICYAAWRR